MQSCLHGKEQSYKDQMENTSLRGAVLPNITSPVASTQQVRDALWLHTAEELLSVYSYSSIWSAMPGIGI